MAKKQKVTDVRHVRDQLDLNQSEFWGRIGVTQSGGSRYESGRPMPAPTAMLFDLVYMGTDESAEAVLYGLRNPE